MYIPPGAIGNMIKKSSKSRETKYKNKKVEFRGMRFDSIGERDRYIFLLGEQDRGEIFNLNRQVSFPLSVNGQHICRYIADFVYEYTDGEKIVEDYKGIITDVFSLKSKLMKAIHGIDVKISRRTSCKLSIYEMEQQRLTKKIGKKYLKNMAGRT